MRRRIKFSQFLTGASLARSDAQRRKGSFGVFVVARLTPTWHDWPQRHEGGASTWPEGALQARKRDTAAGSRADISAFLILLTKLFGRIPAQDV